METELCNISSVVDTRIQFSNIESMEDGLLLSCYKCKEGSNESNGNVICVCKCAYKYIHRRCLEILANTLKILYCPYCHARYPLERQRKSFLKMVLKASVFLFLILFFIYLNFKLGLIHYYNVLLVNTSSLIYIIYKSILSCAFLVITYITWCIIIICSRRMCQIFNKWYKSTQEWKLISKHLKYE